MSSLPSSVTEDTRRRASNLATYFFSRLILAVMLTGLDTFVLLKSALEGLRNSINSPVLHWLLIAAVIVIALSLAHVWYKTLRYRKPTNPNSRNPFL